MAIIGTGVSGLVAARELDRAGCDVSVFEAQSRIGGHSHTVPVETDTGTWDVDTGFIVLNDRNYPRFQALLEELGVATKPAPMTFSVSDGVGDFEWATTPLGLFAKHTHLFDPRFHRMLIDLGRFFREARELVGTAEGESLSLRAFCEQRGYSEYFVERVIVPQASAVWSADPKQLWAFPIGFLAEFLDNHGALQFLGRPRWRSVVGGSRSYVEAITAPFEHRIRTSSPVREVRRHPGGVSVATDAGREDFDEVVFAVHSDQALRMLADPSDAERAILGAIDYQRNDVVLHTDTSLMPRRRRAWASWNFHLDGTETPQGPAAPEGGTTVTYSMNILQRLQADREFLVTLNRSDAIDPEKVIREMTYSHPVYTDASVAAQRRWDEISGVRGTHYCGAYWGWGFHEDGVRSALRVSDAMFPAHREATAAERAPEPLAA